MHTSKQASKHIHAYIHTSSLSLSDAHVVALLPSTSVTVGVGSSTSFTCNVPSSSHVNIASVQWTLNGTLQTDLNITGVETDVDAFGWVLKFTNLPAELNQTRIGCIATLQSGDIVTTETTLLILQGEHFYHCKGCIVIAPQFYILGSLWVQRLKRNFPPLLLRST